MRRCSCSGRLRNRSFPCCCCVLAFVQQHASEPARGRGRGARHGLSVHLVFSPLATDSCDGRPHQRQATGPAVTQSARVVASDRPIADMALSHKRHHIARWPHPRTLVMDGGGRLVVGLARRCATQRTLFSGRPPVVRRALSSLQSVLLEPPAENPETATPSPAAHVQAPLRLKHLEETEHRLSQNTVLTRSAV